MVMAGSPKSRPSISNDRSLKGVCHVSLLVSYGKLDSSPFG